MSAPVVSVPVVTVPAPPAAAPRAPSAARPTVVLVHGLGRTRWSMAPIAWAARRHGYTVHNFGYPSRRGDVAAHAARLAARLATLVDTAPGPVHLVTHSLGGILVRAALARPDAAAWRPRLGRVVMLAPPNQGSELAERLRGWGLFARVMGPAAMELGVGPEAVPAALGALPPDVEVGVIAGDRSWSPLVGRWLPRPHDGKVSVASAQLPGMADFRVVRHGHTLLMLAPDVQAAVLAFLAHGRFAGAASPEAPTPDARTPDVGPSNVGPPAR